jgi:hypothetical protein
MPPFRRTFLLGWRWSLSMHCLAVMAPTQTWWSPALVTRLGVLLQPPCLRGALAWTWWCASLVLACLGAQPRATWYEPLGLWELWTQGLPS